MAQEAETLETRIQHQQSALQAVQLRYKATLEDSEKQTKRLLATQTRQLTDAAVSLRADLDKLDSDIKVRSDLIAGNVVLIATQNQTLETQKLELSAIQIDIKDAEVKYNVILSSLTQAENRLKRQQEGKQGLESAIATLEHVKETVQDEINAMNGRKIALIQMMDALDTKQVEKVAEKEKNIVILDAKILKLMQQADQLQTEQEVTRSSLADWQQRLEIRDKNLRIREAKVEQGEGKLISNSALLEL